MLDHGLTPEQIQFIRLLLKPYAHQIEQVFLFGSRSKGTHRSNSDIDLVLTGQLEQKTIDRLWTLFEESSLPFRVDLKASHLITYPPLKQHIDKNMQLF